MRRRDWYFVIAITLLAAAFRFPTLSVQSLWFDEAVTVRLLHLGFGSMIHDVATGDDSTPPLFYMLGWVWVRVFGESEAGVRSMSALVGTLTVPAAYLAARTLASSRAGLVTATLVAVSPYLIWYSQEARSYALLLLLSVCSLACSRSSWSGRRRSASRSGRSRRSWLLRPTTSRSS
jgi:mannosyltransferase